MTNKQSTNSNLLKLYKEQLSLTEIQAQVLLGTILGDGSLKISSSKKAARLQVCHSFSSKDYVLWKRRIFGEWVLTEPKYYKVNNSLIFRTISHSLIYKYMKLFYLNNKIKIIPENIASLLKSNLSLAVWFMDDGNGYLNHNAYRISTYAFGLKGNTLLQYCLKRNFDLNVKLVRDKKGLQLYIPIKDGSASRFRKIIEPHILPSMRYKIENHSPVETLAIKDLDS